LTGTLACEKNVELNPFAQDEGGLGLFNHDSNFLFHIEAKHTYDAGGGHTASDRASQYDGLLT
jgi:hypothetical protein